MVGRREFVASLVSASALQAADDTVPWTTIQAASALVRARKLSPVELTRSCLARTQRLNGSLNAFITVAAEAALDQARTLESELRAGRWRGTLHGIPVGVKDLFDTEGVRTTAASRHWADRVATEDADVIKHLRQAGAVIIGKTNMDEFAYNFTGETSAFGTSRNPWNPQRSPGGSSGGSAVAVASGMCFAALGSDTGGSIRLPAAFCGITGFKPTYGAVSLKGAAPLAWSLDHAGPMCRSARDAALLLEAMTGRPVHDSAVKVRALRIGIPRGVFYEGLDPQVQKAVDDAIGTFAKLTAGVRDVRLPTLVPSRDLPDLPETYVRIIAAEAYTFHEQRVREHADWYNPGTLRNIRMGASISAADYIRARQEMERLRADIPTLFAASDLLITPTSPGPAFPFGETRLVFLRNTAPWNLLGLPTISIPCGFTSEGLPVGVQITGAAGRDDAVLALAGAYQNVTNWHKRHPPVS